MSKSTKALMLDVGACKLIVLVNVGACKLYSHDPNATFLRRDQHCGKKFSQ